MAQVELPGPSDAPRSIAVAGPAARQPADYKSTHFELHTDLPADEARKLLNRLEVMLRLISKYWGQPCSSTIEMYVVKDLANWPEGSLDSVGRAKIAEDAGITLVETLNRGDELVAAKAVVYAIADRGTPQHEAVHAYCGQTFGRVGPLWYAEGMAELGNYWRPDDASVECPDYILEYLRANRPKPLRAILGEEVDRPGRPAAATGDSWQNYAWRWALCHMLENNPNYAERFRPLGLGYLTGQNVSFLDAFGSMMPELAFEYRFFVSHVGNGYRVDLCAWDWHRKFDQPQAAPIVSRIAARRGWQPSGAIVSPEVAYEYSAGGQWSLGKEAANVTADGGADGAGRLEGAILSDYQLGEPFPLGAAGTFQPPAAGQLYLRCRDDWSALADNRGNLRVRIKRADKGPALPGPTNCGDVEEADE
ncbi:MAG: hypothetical protein WD845_02045 [Pirellulales bacterium]